MTRKPNSPELEKAQEQFNAFEKSVNDLTLDRMAAAPIADREPQTKIAQKDMDKKPEMWLKPFRTYPSKEKFNENFRKEYEFQREYVQFIAENIEIIGEEIHIGGLKKFPGTPVEEWKVPVNKPVWAPRMVAERISESRYHRLMMKDQPTHQTGTGMFYGQMVVDETRQRLDARPVSTHRSVFMGVSAA